MSSNDDSNNYSSDTNDEESKEVGRKQYTLNQKRGYVQMIEEKGVIQTSQETGIHVSNLKRWRKTIPLLNELSGERLIRSDKRMRLKGGGRKSTITEEVQEELVEFVSDLRERDIEVNSSIVVQKLISIDGCAYASASRRALRRRIWRVLDNNDYTRRKTTHQAQMTRLSENEKLHFVKYIQDKMTSLGIDKSAVCNFDETNVGFSWESRSTINKKGATTVSVAKPSTTQRCTAMIGVSGSGYKFPPFVIFKGESGPRATVNRLLRSINSIQETTTDGEHLGYPLSIRYAVQSNAWMDATRMHKWIDDVYVPWATEIAGPNLVILDIFSVHAMTEIVNRIADYEGHVELLPPHSTSVLQVMDVGINKPFKNHLKEQYDMWCLEHINDARQKPQREDVSKWIKKSWDRITTTTIKKTWKHIGWNFDDEEIVAHDFGYVDDDSVDFMDYGTDRRPRNDDPSIEDDTSIEDDPIIETRDESSFF
jgi:DDE superfamily endonuclease